MEIPGQSEAVIDVFIARDDIDDLIEESNYIVEPTEHSLEEYPLKMAASLVNINSGATNKVRLLNPFPTPVTIRQDAVLGVAERIKGQPKVLTSCEYNEEKDNNIFARRISMQPSESEPGSKMRNVQFNTKKPQDIPSHLKQLYETASKGRSPQEQAK